MASNAPRRGSGASNKGSKTGKPQETTGLPIDKLNKQQLRALYGYTAKQLEIDPEFKKIFDEAWTGQWQGDVGKARFIARLEDTEWWRTNSKSMRDYLFASVDPESADFMELQTQSQEYVRQTAMKKGVPLDDARIEELATQSLMGGWGEPGKAYNLERAIVGSSATGAYTGDIKTTADNLAGLAMANGVEMSDNFYQSAAKSVASGLTGADYWENQIREQGASMFPVFAEQIRLGVNVSDIASPYLRTMADTLDLNPNTIKLNDPTIMGALTNYNDQGKPYAMNLGEFKQKLRERPEWLTTDKAQNDITSITSSVMKMFGLRG